MSERLTSCRTFVSRLFRGSSAHPLLGTARRRHTLVLSVCLVALLGLGSTVWASPPMNGRGPTADQVALQREQARSTDLKAQLDEANARLTSPRPAPTGEVRAAGARADDLKAQLDDTNARLVALGARSGKPTPVPGRPGQTGSTADQAQAARADDLKAQLDTVTARLAAARPAARDTAQQARAEDLAAQVQELSGQLSAPRPPTPAPVPTLAPPPAPVMLSREQVVRSHDLFGLYTKESPFFMGEFDALEASVGRDANVSGYFQSWDTPFRADATRSAWARGEIPMLTWESQLDVGEGTANQPDYSNAQIVAGRHDAYIRQYAADITANGQTVVLRFDHEMNGIWYPWAEGRKLDGPTNTRQPTNGNAPGSYVQMWRHVHDIFEAEGANEHVVWMWAPNRIDRLGSPDRSVDFLQSLYPGDDYVDMVGISGYLRNGFDPGTTYEDVFGATLAQLADVAPTKPVVLAEVGAAQAVSTKSVYVESFLRGAAADGRVAGFVWFSLAVPGSDFRIDSSESSLEAFRTAMATSPFGRPR